MKEKEMKSLIKFICFLILPSAIFSQIPNAGFENWTNDAPDGWATTNIEGFDAGVTQSIDAHSGFNAVKLEVVSFFETPAAAAIFSESNEQLLFPIGQRYLSVRGFYKFHQENPMDVIFATATVYAQDTSTVIGFGAAAISEPQTSYTEFEIPIQYILELNTGFMYLTFITSSNDTVLTIGSYFLLDDLSLSMVVTGLEKGLDLAPDQFSLDQNYPNPFNPQTTIKYNLAENAYVNLVVYDNMGRQVQTLINQHQTAGSYSVKFDGSDLASGIYYYRIEVGNFSKTRHMLLIK